VSQCLQYIRLVWFSHLLHSFLPQHVSHVFVPLLSPFIPPMLQHQHWSSRLFTVLTVFFAPLHSIQTVLPVPSQFLHTFMNTWLHGSAGSVVPGSFVMNLSSLHQIHFLSLSHVSQYVYIASSTFRPASVTLYLSYLSWLTRSMAPMGIMFGNSEYMIAFVPHFAYVFNLFTVQSSSGIVAADSRTLRSHQLPGPCCCCHFIPRRTSIISSWSESFDIMSFSSHQPLRSTSLSGKLLLTILIVNL